MALNLPRLFSSGTYDSRLALIVDGDGSSFQSPVFRTRCKFIRGVRTVEARFPRAVQVCLRALSSQEDPFINSFPFKSDSYVAQRIPFGPHRSHQGILYGVEFRHDGGFVPIDPRYTSLRSVVGPCWNLLAYNCDRCLPREGYGAHHVSQNDGCDRLLLTRI